MQNKFGVNKVIGFTKVEDTSQFFDGLDSRPWDILSASKSDGEQLQEIRIHFRSFSEVQAARRLVDAETPRQFITAVVHAMLGHFNLYEDRNILHCGISADTILITDDTIRDPMERFPLVGSKCQGILLGGETGHAEGSTDREVDTFGLDLLHYLPSETLWSNMRNRHYNRGIMDDLESGLWVMIIEYLKIVVRDKPDFEFIPIWHQRNLHLTADRSGILRLKRDIFVDSFNKNYNPPGFGAFQNFFILWYNSLRDNSARFGSNVPHFFDTILAYLSRENEDWDTWEAFWAAGGGISMAQFFPMEDE